MAVPNASISGEINQISGEIGQLKAVTQRLQASQDHMLGEVREISTRMISVAEVITELREFRKTLHERFGHVHLQISDIDKKQEQTEEIVTRLNADVTSRFERRTSEVTDEFKDHTKRLSKLEEFTLLHGLTTEDIKDNTKRIIALENFVMIFRANWKTFVVGITVVSSVVGWLLATYGSIAIKHLAGGA